MSPPPSPHITAVALEENLPAVDPKALKAIVKEGGKKGAEVAGAADMGGMTHMNVSLDLPEGRTDMMLKALEAMNVGRFRICCRSVDLIRYRMRKTEAGHCGPWRRALVTQGVWDCERKVTSKLDFELIF